jgi:hypothetical protein
VLEQAQKIFRDRIDMVALLEGPDFVGSAMHASRVERKYKFAIYRLALKKRMHQREAEIATAAAKNAGEDQPLPAGSRTPYYFSSALRAYLHCVCQRTSAGVPLRERRLRVQRLRVDYPTFTGLRANIF